VSDKPGRVAIPADSNERVDLGGLGIVWKLEGADAEDRFSVVHHPLAPRALAAPLHRHSREDEYSYVIEGTLGALLGDEVVTAGPGTWVLKPRNQWHTFWNAGDTPCEIIEVISPAGFENFFRELAEVYAAGEDGPDLASFAALCERYGLEMDPTSVPGLCQRFGVTHPLAPAEPALASGTATS
jgi:mannose-6-phosphate isomerase-like protein (cupin superfamily)